MSFKGTNDELKQNELFDLKEKGILVAGTAAGTFKLSTDGQEYFNRLVRTLPSKDQVAIQLMVGGNAEKNDTQIKDFMQQ